MDSRWPCFFSILHIFFSSVQLCEIPGGNVQPIKSLNIELLRLTEDVSEEPNPSLYLGLRLSDHHDLEKESRYLERLKDAFRPNATSSPSEAVHYQEQPSTGGLALYLLALRAACHNMETPEGNRLITQLKLHLHKEKLKIGHASDGYPITNYYQYSLGVLALCTHEKKIDEHVIHKLLHAEKHGLFRHNSDISVDTEAMAGLAFACLQQQTPFYPHELLAKLNLSLQRVTEKILQAQTSEGAFGNIYSSPLAVQFLIATRTHQKKPECPAAVAALFQNLEKGNFRNALIKSQLLPVFYGKSYLDITHKECQTERGGAEESLVLAAPTPASGKANPQRRIGVQLVVKRPPRRDYLYKQVLYVPLGSSLLDVLKAAEKQTRVPFTFETQNSLSGPMLTGVMGIKAEAGERKYWKILRAPHFVLDEGIADYIPKHKETIILRFTSW